MPMIEVLHSSEKPLEREKRAFAKEAERVLEEVLAHPGRMRLTFQHLPPEDSLGLLAEGGPTAGSSQEGEPGPLTLQVFEIERRVGGGRVQPFAVFALISCQFITSLGGNIRLLPAHIRRQVLARMSCA